MLHANGISNNVYKTTRFYTASDTIFHTHSYAVYFNIHVASYVFAEQIRADATCSFHHWKVIFSIRGIFPLPLKIVSVLFSFTHRQRTDAMLHECGAFTHSHPGALEHRFESLLETKLFFFTHPKASKLDLLPS